MKSTARHFALTVLLGFLLSLVAVSAHAATHANADAADCQLCSGYGDGPDDSQITTSALLVIPKATLRHKYSLDGFRSTSYSAAHARAPPAGN